MVFDVGTTVFFFVRIHHTINIRLSLLILNEKRPISFSSANGSFGAHCSLKTQAQYQKPIWGQEIIRQNLKCTGNSPVKVLPETVVTDCFSK